VIRFGVGAIAEAPELLSASGFDNYALLTTDRAAPDARQVVDNAYLVANVPAGPVPEAAAAVRERVADRPLVALGGGRVIDTAKAIAGADGQFCAAIPTTLSGAEMTPFHRMPAGVEEYTLVRPALVLAAPGLMGSQPMPDLAASAMNALAHATEALYTPLSNPIARMAGLRAARLIGAGLAQEDPNRHSLALGALLAGYASGIAGFGIHHAVCQTIVRLCGTPRPTRSCSRTSSGSWSCAPASRSSSSGRSWEPSNAAARQPKRSSAWGGGRRPASCPITAWTTAHSGRSWAPCRTIQRCATRRTRPASAS
jgi:alcohol dehydrogenase class IV